MAKHIPNNMLLPLKEGFYDINSFLTGNFLACNFCVRCGNPNLHLFLEDRAYNIMEDWVFLVQNLQNDRIFIMDKVTLSMIDHGARSMRSGNEIIINKREIATRFILDNVKISPKQKNTIKANSYYFCGIHYYLDFNRKQGLKSVFKAVKLEGWNKRFFCFDAKAAYWQKVYPAL